MANNPSYTPTPGTVSFKVIAHLQTMEPGAEISNREICNLMGTPINGTSTLLGPAVRASYLTKRMVEVHGQPGKVHWRLGPKSKGYVPPADSTPVPADEQQVMSLSANAAPSIFAYAAQRGAAPFSAALSTDGRLSIERHGRLLLELNNEERALVVAAATSVSAAPQAGE